jgi:hypothetical protein
MCEKFKSAVKRIIILLQLLPVNPNNYSDTIRCVFMRSIIRFHTDRKRTVLTLHSAVNAPFLRHLRSVFRS